jgi:hypothetical protein
MPKEKTDVGIIWDITYLRLSPDLLAKVPPIDRVYYPLDHLAGKITQM